MTRYNLILVIAMQNLGFASALVLCGLPVKPPYAGQFLHERRNRHFLRLVIGHPSYGLPSGQDRLVPIFLATLAIRQRNQLNRFRSAAEMLARFGTQQGGPQYWRLMAASRQLKVKRVSELRSRRVSQRFRLDVRDSTRD
jgi:hypothetical protein